MLEKLGEKISNMPDYKINRLVGGTAVAAIISTAAIDLHHKATTVPDDVISQCTENVNLVIGKIGEANPGKDLKISEPDLVTDCVSARIKARATCTKGENETYTCKKISK